MKKMLAVIVLFSFVATSKAYEQPRNPDRFISLGLNVENLQQSGDFTAVSMPSVILTDVSRGPAQENYTGIGLDVRIPANDCLTLSAGYMNLVGDSSHSRDNGLYTEKIKFTGYRLNFGARLYFNR